MTDAPQRVALRPGDGAPRFAVSVRLTSELRSALEASPGAATLTFNDVGSATARDWSCTEVPHV